MEQTDFKEQYYAYHGERERLESERATLEARLSEIKMQIDHLVEIMQHLSPLAGFAYRDSDIAGLGITDAIRYVLKNSKERVAARDVQAALEEKGFDLSGYTSPMASIYKILARLADDSKEIEREKEDYKVFYRWKHPPDEISDEDIPF